MSTIFLTDNQKCLHRIILETKFIKDSGLFYGQTGIILVLATLYRETTNGIYEECMSKFLDILTENLSNNLALNFDNGLSGIGWGIEYLIQNQYIAGNSLDICEEIDEKIMQENICRMKDFSLDTGLEGRLHYILSHIKGVWNQIHNFPFDKNYLEDVYMVICNVKKEQASPCLMSLINIYKEFYEIQRIPDYSFDLDAWVDLPKSKFDLVHSPLGLKNGIAGFLLTMND